MQFVDSHCHLDDKQYDEDRAVVLARAREAGLKWILAIGTGDGPPDLEVAVRQAEAYSCVLASVGVHPNDSAKVREETFPHLKRLLQHPKVVAIGEIGLDYHWNPPGSDQVMQQELVFRQQLQLAAAADMPVIIHTRDAWDDTLSILKQEWSGPKPPCIMHCFTGDAAQAEAFLSLGCYLAFGGVATFPKATAVRDAARVTPLSRLLLETDAPYLAPVPYRGKRNEPSHVLHTAKVLAELRNESLEQLAAQSTANFERIFLTLKPELLHADQPTTGETRMLPPTPSPC